MLGKGLVAVIENTSDRYLTVMLSVRNPTLSTARRYKLNLDPKSSTTLAIWKAGSLPRVTRWDCSTTNLAAFG